MYLVHLSHPDSPDAKASGYHEDTIAANIVQGDISNWLDAIGIPAFFVLLPDSSSPQMQTNLRGIEAIINQITQVSVHPLANKSVIPACF